MLPWSYSLGRELKTRYEFDAYYAQYIQASKGNYVTRDSNFMFGIYTNEYACVIFCQSFKAV